jgi:hypothetical protein
MKKITEIYDTYRIFSGLREHQVRVAAVASTIVNAAYEPLPKEAIIAACLLHDMGNIIKAPLGSLPELLEPEGISYWQTVKEDFVKTYGLDEHIATVRIAREIGVSNEVIHLIESFGFGKSFLRRDSMTLPEKICGYADMRVGPFGIISLEAPKDPHGSATCGGLIYDFSQKSGISFQGLYSDNKHLKI